MPRVSHEDELSFTTNRLTLRMAASKRLIFSHAREVDDSAHGPSPLLEAIPSVVPQSVIKNLRLHSRCIGS